MSKLNDAQFNKFTYVSHTYEIIASHFFEKLRDNNELRRPHGGHCSAILKKSREKRIMRFGYAS